MVAGQIYVNVWVTPVGASTPRVHAVKNYPIAVPLNGDGIGPAMREAYKQYPFGQFDHEIRATQNPYP